MSFRFNKTAPSDFGLTGTECENIFIDENDGSKWEKRYLIDLGWGEEVTFCKIPLPSFEQLLDLALSGKSDTNFYSSIGVLLKDYPDEFLSEIEKLLGKFAIKNKEFLPLIRGQMLLDPNILARSNDKDRIDYYERWQRNFSSFIFKK